MSTVACFRCGSPKWHATGEFDSSRWVKVRARLVCDVCGYRFASGYPDAIQAASAERGECGELPAPSETCPVPVPQPSLPMQAPRTQGFVTPRNWAKRMAEDFKRRAAGEVDEEAS